MYKPTLIHDARVEVVSQHPLVNNPEYIKGDKGLEKLIRRIVKLDEKDIKKEALVLSGKDIKKIIGYMPFNDFNVKLDNLFAVYEYRAKPIYAEYLFLSWLESYDRKDFNKLAVKYLLNEEFFLKQLKSVNLNKDIFLQWLTVDNIPYFVGKFAYNSRSDKNSFEESLIYYGITNTSQLFLKCESLFYTYCHKKDYLKCDKTKLFKMITGYDDYLFRMFLKNFVMQLSIAELSEHNDLMPTVTSYTGEIVNSKQFINYFEGEDSTFVEKYIDWLNSYLVMRIFGNDPRGRFWSKFRFTSTPKRMDSNDAIVMRLNGYVAVEFIGKGSKAYDALGPVYFYKNDYYERVIRKWVNNAVYNNSRLRKKLYDDWPGYNTDEKMRYTHHGDWEIPIERDVLNSYNMTTRLYSHGYYY